jgi:hypothetical protein
MQRLFRFSLRRLFVDTPLIAVGFAALADFRAAVQNAPPMSVLNVIEGFVGLPLIGAGLFTPFRHPILGACLGILCFPVFLLWLAVITGGMSI